MIFILLQDDSPSSFLSSQSMQAIPGDEDMEQDSEGLSQAEASISILEPVYDSEREEADFETEDATPPTSVKPQKRGKQPKDSKMKESASAAKKPKTGTMEDSFSEYFRSFVAVREERERRRKQEEQQRREEEQKRREEEQKRENTANAPLYVWGRSLVHDLESFRSERRRREVKMKIMTIVHTALMEEMDENEP